MSRKQVLIGLAVVVFGAALVAALRLLHRAPADESEETPPTLVTVQTARLQRMTLHRYVTGYGTVGPTPAMANRPAAAAAVAAPVAGVVTQVDVVEGQQVGQGQLLVELNSGAMTEAYAEAELARQKELFAQHNTSLKSLQNAEAQLALLRVTAPLAGTVVAVNVKPGAAVDVNTVLAEVMDLTRLVVRTGVPTPQAGELAPGQEVQVLAPTPVTADLAYVSPTVDTNSGTVWAWATLPRDSGLRPGQFVPLRIVTAAHTNCLAAPEAGVVTDIAGQSVLALVKGNEATRAVVRTGFRENGWVEVQGAGLHAGDTVVTVGAYGLPEKTKIQVVSPGSE